MMKEKPYAKLRGRMAEKGISQKLLAKQLGISETAMANKFNALSDFKAKEMQIIYNILELEDVASYFFVK